VAASLAFAIAVCAEVPPINVEEITVTTGDDGLTVVEITVDQPLQDGSYHSFQIAGESPRKVLCLRNVVRPYHRSLLPVGDQRLLRVRTGYHPELSPPELHIVLDLASDRFSNIRTSHQARQLRIELGTPPVAAEEPADDVAEVASTPVTATAEAASPESQDDSQATVITAIEAVEQENGSTVVTITADRPFAPFSIRELFLAGNPPHYALSFTSVVLAETAPTRQVVSGDTLSRIEVMAYPLRQPSEVQLDLTLASTEVTVTEVVQDGPRLIVQLGVTR
jgi:hypothetical protein